jgi:hypothetical protein
MAGCAMIGQSVNNVRRVSGLHRTIRCRRRSCRHR